jgi:hypothetical protein
VSAAKTRERFEALRARYLDAKAKWAALHDALGDKYGSGYQDSWLRAGERSALARLRKATERWGDAFTEHVATFSPRDWSYGVPQAWVREDLTYEDAARPVGEPLSVVPPVAWGYEVPRT